MADHYTTLGVNKDATQDDIKKAYRKLAAKHHPDRGGDTATFQEIAAAYEILSNPEKRQQYDNPRPQFGDGFQQYGGMPEGFEDLFRNFGGPFGDIFGGRRPQPVRNRTLNVQTNISLEDAFNGKILTSTLRLPSGRDQTVEIKIPAGIRSNTTLRLAGVGDDSVSNVPRGDIHLTVNVLPHPTFKREGDDLIFDLEISCFDAILGKTIRFDTIDGKTLETNVPPGIQPGQQLNVYGHGMPNMNNSLMRGRLLININITIPTTLTDSQKTELRKIIQ